MTNEYPDSTKAFLKAEEAIKHAEYNFVGGYYAVTLNRTYYSCYYCLTALLYTQNIYSKTHLGVRAKFSELFIKPGFIAVGMSDAISMLFDYRQTADYDLNGFITANEAELLINKAKEVYKATNDYFQNTICKQP